MNECVVEVGPGTVRGSADAAPELVATALECIDDDIAVLDEQPVAVAALWREVFRSVIPDQVDTAVLVCPTWWPPSRLELVREAAAARSAGVVVLQRGPVLAADVPGIPTVVEIAPEFVVVSRAGSVLAAEPRLGELPDVARSVARGVGAATGVLVDAPAGLHDAVPLAAAIAECVRADGVPVTRVHRDRVLAAEHRRRSPTRAPRSSRSRRPRAWALGVAVVSVALLCAGVGAHAVAHGPPSPAVPMTLLVEGRVAVRIPAQWEVRRITNGPGSARLQATAPDNSAAVLVTQSQVGKGESLAATAAALRSALDGQQAGVFVGFNPADRRADRAAATYRELRADRQIDWVVFVDATVRIGVGCQSAPGAEQAVRYACEEAIRSARAIV